VHQLGLEDIGADAEIDMIQAGTDLAEFYQLSQAALARSKVQAGALSFEQAAALVDRPAEDDFWRADSSISAYGADGPGRITLSCDVATIGDGIGGLTQASSLASGGGSACSAGCRSRLPSASQRNWAGSHRIGPGGAMSLICCWQACRAVPSPGSDARARRSRRLHGAVDALVVSSSGEGPVSHPAELAKDASGAGWV
jgi:hypothetical protein